MAVRVLSCPRIATVSMETRSSSQAKRIRSGRGPNSDQSESEPEMSYPEVDMAAITKRALSRPFTSISHVTPSSHLRIPIAKGILRCQAWLSQTVPALNMERVCCQSKLALSC